MNTPLITRQDHNGVALVTIDNPPVNALGQTARQQLCAMIARLDQDDNIRAVVLTGQGKVFVGGADISEFDRPPEAPHLPDAISAIEASRKPWVAAINGAALGGGAELALGCHYRILANSARIALPETKLGIIPGAGGTQRLPRLIGNALATDVITNGREIAAAESLDIGFADRAAAGDLIEEALDFAQQIASKPLPVPAAERPLADPGAHFWNTALKRITKAARGNPAPAAALSAIRTGTTSGFAAGMAQERETFLSLRGSEEAAALRYLFFAERAALRPSSLRGETSSSLRHIGVVGGGTMGSGIAAALASAGLHVELAETSRDALQAGMARVEGIFAAQVKRGLCDEVEAADRLVRVRGRVGCQAMARCDMVIEAVFEDRGIKRAVFEELVGICSPDMIIATNTSYLDPDTLVRDLPGQDRFIALHFFSPAHVMKLLEIVPLKGSSTRTLATCFALAGRLGKIPVQAGNCEGFIGNRIVKRLRAGAEAMLRDGLGPEQIDRAMRDYGFGMGPFETQDMAGLDIAFRAREAARACGENVPEMLGDILVRAGRLGQKTRAGWYDYADDDRTPQPSAEVARLLKPLTGVPRPQSSAEIATRLIAIMADEGQKILDEGIARNPEDIDLVKVHGYGFPRHKGGPMFHTARRAVPPLHVDGEAAHVIVPEV